MYINCGHDYTLLCTYQLDPGRLLYSWTVGRRAELRPGEAIVLCNEHVGALAAWLEGLNGMTFKIILDNDLDDSKLRLKASTRKMLGSSEGLAIKKTAALRGKRPIYQRRVRTFSTIRRGFGSCSCSMCGE